MAVGVETRGFVRIITIDNPARRNALDRETFEGVGSPFTDACADAKEGALTFAQGREPEFRDE